MLWSQRRCEVIVVANAPKYSVDFSWFALICEHIDGLSPTICGLFVLLLAHNNTDLYNELNKNQAWGKSWVHHRLCSLQSRTVNSLPEHIKATANISNAAAVKVGKLNLVFVIRTDVVFCLMYSTQQFHMQWSLFRLATVPIMQNVITHSYGSVSLPSVKTGWKLKVGASFCQWKIISFHQVVHRDCRLQGREGKSSGSVDLGTPLITLSRD